MTPKTVVDVFFKPWPPSRQIFLMCVFNFIFNWVFDSNVYWLDKHVVKVYVASFLMWWNVIKNVEGQKEILRHPLSSSND